MFWPASQAAHAAHALRQAVYRLRQLGVPVESDGSTISIRSEFSRCDAREIIVGGTDSSRELAPGTGDPGFLPHFSPAFSSEFQSWLDETRAVVRGKLVRAHLKILQDSRRDARWQDVEVAASRVLALDPLNEEATLATAESAAMSGSKAAALDLLDNYARELGERAETIGLPAVLLRRRIAERSRVWHSTNPAEVALVGRHREMLLLASMLEDARHGRGHSLLLTGAPGIGKTRLAIELLRSAHLIGAHCISEGASAPDRGRPMSLATRVARTVLEAPGAVGASPEAFGLLRRITSTGPAVSIIEAIAAGPMSVESVAWALAEVLAAVTSEVVTVLHCDDLHHSDEHSLAILSRVAATASSTRFLLIGTSRTPIPSESNPIRDDRWTRAENVAPLSADTSEHLVSALARSLGCEHAELTKSEIVRAAGGNPLFLRELTTHLREGGKLAVPPSGLTQAIEQRLSDLSADEVRVLRRVATLGSLASQSRLRALEVPNASALPLVIDRLESLGVLSAGNGGRLTMHECWLQSVRSRTGSAVSAAMALEVAELLLSETTEDDLVEARWRASDLFLTAGDNGRARANYLVTGSELLRRGATRSAVIALEKACSLSPQGERRLEAAAQLAVAHHVNGDMHAAHSTCRAALEGHLHISSNASSFEALLLALLADSAHLIGLDPSAELLLAEEVLERADIDGEVCQQVCLYLLRTLLADDLTDRARRVRDISRRAAARSRMTIFGALTDLIVAAENGTREEAYAADSLLASMSTSGLPPGLLTLSLRYRSVNLRFLCEHDRAAALSHQVLRIATEHGIVRERRSALFSLAFQSLDVGHLEEAARWIDACREADEIVIGSDVERSLAHAVGRLLLDRGDYEECVRHFAPLSTRIANDPMGRRRAVDQACVALSLAMLGRVDQAQELLTELETVTLGSHPGAQFDFVVDCVLRGFDRIGQGDRAARLALAYSAERRARYDRPVVPVLRRLSATIKPPGPIAV